MNRRDALCLVGTTVAGLGTPTVLRARPAGRSAGRTTPGDLDPFLSGFDFAKAEPGPAVETDHHCVRLNDDVLQCVLFQAGGRKLLGVEYVISDRLYRQLPLEEKAFWHPYAYEVLAGHLAAPDLSVDREDDLLSGLVTTWGKTWQTWPDPDTPVPEGALRLLWSVTGDGQVPDTWIDARDRRVGGSTRARRSRRRTLGLPVPQVAPPESVTEIGRPWGGREPRV